MSLELASQLFDWSSIALAIGACIVFIATAAIVWLGIVKEHHWDLLRESAQREIAGLKVESDKANAELGKAHADIANANVRITEATARTTEAELKLAQLRKFSGPRLLNQSVFLKELADVPKSPVEIWYLPDSSDGYLFSFQLYGALIGAGWKPESPKAIPEPPQNMAFPSSGIPRAVLAGGQPSGATLVGHLSEKENLSFKGLYAALAKSTEFGFTGSVAASFFFPLPDGTFRIVIAAKTDPIFIEPQELTPK